MRATTALRPPPAGRRQRYAQAVKRTTGRISLAGERRPSEVSVADRIHLRSPIYGVASAGVRQRRVLERREHDFNARLREAHDGGRGTGAPFWRG
jgi:hypothetical protein